MQNWQQNIVSLSRYRYCFISQFLGTSAAGEEYLVPNLFLFFFHIVYSFERMNPSAMSLPADNVFALI